METLLSRSGNSSGLGKCTEKIRTDVPEVVKEYFVSASAAANITEAEYVRDWLIFVRAIGSAGDRLRRSINGLADASGIPVEEFVVAVLEEHMRNEIHGIRVRAGLPVIQGVKRA